MIQAVEETEAYQYLLDINQIMAVLPHRYPFLLLDRIVKYEPGVAIEGYKNVSINEPFMSAYQPDNPVFPPTLIVEALAQLGGVMVANLPEGRGKLGLLIGIEEARFYEPIYPGDQLYLRSELIRIRGNLGKAKGQASVNGKVVGEGRVLFALAPNKD